MNEAELVLPFPPLSSPSTCSAKLGACSAALWLVCRDGPWRHPHPFRSVCLKTVPLHVHLQGSSTYSSAPLGSDPAPLALGICRAGCEPRVWLSSPHTQVQLCTMGEPLGEAYLARGSCPHWDGMICTLAAGRHPIPSLLVFPPSLDIKKPDVLWVLFSFFSHQLVLVALLHQQLQCRLSTTETAAGLTLGVVTRFTLSFAGYKCA